MQSGNFVFMALVGWAAGIAQGQTPQLTRAANIPMVSYLGVATQDVSAEMAKALKLPEASGVEVTKLDANSPAAAAGFQAGDVVKSINGQPIDSFEALQESTLMSTGLPMNFVVERQGADVDLTATPQVTVVDQGVFGKRRMGHLGLASSADKNDAKVERCGLATCAAWGAAQEWFIVKATGTYIVGIFAGRESTDQMSGLIGAAQMAGEMAKISLWELFSLAAWFSVSVGLMNLLPIPLLDGGHLAFYAFEALRGRPLSERAQEIGLRIGIALVALLVVFTTSHDLFRLVSSGN